MKLEASIRLAHYHQVQTETEIQKEIKDTENFIRAKKAYLATELPESIKQKTLIIIRLLEQQLVELKQEIKDHDFKVAASADWFSALSKEEQKKYVEQHPHSKYALDYDNAMDALPPDDNGDAQRIKDLKMQISHLVQDIKEMEAEGENPSLERKQLESLRGELAELTQ